MKRQANMHYLVLNTYKLLPKSIPKNAEVLIKWIKKINKSNSFTIELKPTLYVSMNYLRNIKKLKCP